jgi:opine dehydrogenase
VLGAGHGGLALAAYLAQAGQRVAMWNRSPARLDAVAAAGRVRLTMPGSSATTAPIAMAASDIAAVLHGASVVLVAVPASGHAEVARTCAPHLRDGQAVLLLPGRTGGALEFRRVLQECGCRANILLGEANSFPVAARTVAPAEAVVYGVKAKLTAAALPSRDTSTLIAPCRPLLPMLTPARSVLQTGFSNVGAILHPTITLVNADRIRRGEAFDFYTDGVTLPVAELLATADVERLRIAAAYGERVPSLTEWIASAYGHRANTVLDALAANPAYRGIKAPTTLQHRYLFEDVPTGLLPLIELGAAAGLAVPALRSLVALAESTLGIESWRDERSLQSLGLGGLDIEEIRTVVTFGSTMRRPGLVVPGSLHRPVFAGRLEGVVA